MFDADPEVEFEACFNFRDLGGCHTTDGRRMKTGVVYRSDSLHRLTEADLTVAARLGVRTVIDMRSKGEVARQGWCAVNASFHHLPWYEDETRPFELSKPGDGTPDFATAYLTLTLACSDAVLRTFDLLAHEDHAIVFHCSAGKDRTGIVAALLLSILGVPDESIVADYALTEGAAARQREWAMSHDRGLVGEMDRTPEWVLRASAETMTGFLSLIRDRFRSVQAFLDHLGVAQDTRARLRHRLLET